MYHVSCIMYALASVSNFDGGAYKNYITVLYILLRALFKTMQRRKDYEVQS